MTDTLIRGIAAAALVFSACGADPGATGDWVGTVYDSAGVVVVENTVTGLWTQAAAWRLEEELRIGVATGDPIREFGRVADIAVDASGRIYVLDRHAQEIRVFDDDGGFVRTIGRPGSGPGELSSPSAVLLGTADTIFVPDTPNQRVQRFLADGSEAGTFPVSPAGGIPLEWRIRADGLLLEEVRTLPAREDGEERILLLVRAGDGEIRDTLVEMPVGGAMVLRDGQPYMTMFAPEPMWTSLIDGRIATGRNSEYELEIRAPQGHLERVVRRPFERRPFSKSHRRALRVLIREHFENQSPSPATDRMLQSLDYSDHYPVYAGLFGGPNGTLWVQQARDVLSLELEDMADFNVRAFPASEFEVFDRDGRFLGTIRSPDGFRPMHSEGEYVYGVQRDDLGVQYVVRLRVMPQVTGA